MAKAFSLTGDLLFLIRCKAPNFSVENWCFQGCEGAVI